jgi:ligand-binding sensor domain-containing protein
MRQPTAIIAQVLSWLVLLVTARQPLAAAGLDPHRPLASFLHESWQTQQGLPQNSVLSLAQTKDGYLWIGTEEGLSRFDGAHFSTISTGLQNKTVTALLASADGTLWVGTNGGGLAHSTAGTFAPFNTRNGLPNNSILCLFEDSKGTVWAGTDGGGLVAFEHGVPRVFTKADGLPDNVVFSLAGSPDGALWIGTRSGLVRYSGGFGEPVPELADKHVRSVVAGRNGVIWAGTTSDGLYRIADKQITRYSKANGLASDQIQSLFQDASGTLYVGTMNQGILRFDGTSFSGFSGKQSLLGAEVHAILEDREGDLWIGTAGGGLDCLKEGVFSMLTSKDGLPSDTILPILQDRDGALWIGSDRGLTYRKGDRTAVFTTKDGLPDDLILSVAQDSTGEIWAGTRRGLAKFSSGRWSIFTTRDGLGSDFVTSLFVDHSGKIWAGTRGGLSVYDGKFTNFTTHEGLSNNYVLAIAEDAEGAIWAGTEGGGVTRIQNGKFASYNSHNGLSNDVVRAIYADPSGSMWFATNGGGLNRLKNNRFTAIKSDRGLFDDSLHSILADGAGRLWLTSNHGVFSVDLKQLNDFADGKTPDLIQRVYGTADGLRTSEFNGGFQPASCRLRDGRLLFPTTGGVAIIDRDPVNAEMPPPVPAVERVLIDQRTFSPFQSVLAPPGKGQLEIQFAAPEFRSPNSVQFSYMLEGFEKEWTPAGNRRTAYYTNIPPGEYRFRIRVNTGGNANSETVLPVSLTPHFYQTLAFYTFTSVLILTGCATFYGWRVNELRDRERNLLALVHEKTAALRDSERMLRRSRDELEIRVQERTLEMVRANQALQTEIFVRRQAETQLRAAKEEAEASAQSLRIILSSVGRELLDPIHQIQEQSLARLDQHRSGEEDAYLESITRSAASLSRFIAGLVEAAAVDCPAISSERGT